MWDREGSSWRPDGVCVLLFATLGEYGGDGKWERGFCFYDVNYN